MKPIQIDADKFAQAGLEFQAGDAFATFTWKGDGDKPVKVTVQVEAGSLLFFPDRSSLHKTVLAKLSVPI